MVLESQGMVQVGEGRRTNLRTGFTIDHRRRRHETRNLPSVFDIARRFWGCNVYWAWSFSICIDLEVCFVCVR